MKKRHILTIIALFLTSLSTNAQIINVNYSGVVTDIGSLLTGDGIAVGTTMNGSFTYDTAGGGVVDEFSTSFANGFFASIGPSGGTITVQNDQMNGSATLPADGFRINANDTTSNTLNGYANPDMQFGIRQQNIDGQLWDDTLPPDLNDWSLITLAAINAPDWRWLDFGLSTTNFPDDQIRWEVTEFSVSAVPVPAAVWLFGTALIGFVGYSRRRRIS